MSDTNGTFESDTGGTFGVIYSLSWYENRWLCPAALKVNGFLFVVVDNGN